MLIGKWLIATLKFKMSNNVQQRSTRLNNVRNWLVLLYLQLVSCKLKPKQPRQRTSPWKWAVGCCWQTAKWTTKIATFTLIGAFDSRAKAMASEFTSAASPALGSSTTYKLPSIDDADGLSISLLLNEELLIVHLWECSHCLPTSVWHFVDHFELQIVCSKLAEHRAMCWYYQPGRVAVVVFAVQIGPLDGCRSEP